MTSKSVLIRSKKFDDLVSKLASAQKSKKVGKVGWVEKSRYTNGVLVAMVAAVQEHGDPAKNIPARSMLGATVEKQKDEWDKIVIELGKNLIENDSPFEVILEGLVSRASGDVRKTISDLTEPPLKKSTIAARLRKRKDRKTIGKLDKPLIDTGVLQDTVVGVVQDE